MAVWSDNITHIFPSSISSIKLRFFGATIDDAYYAVRSITDATAKLIEYTDVDRYGRPQIAYSHTLQLVFTTMETGAVYLIKKLEDMARVHVKVVLDNANTISTGLMSSHSLETTMGVDWEYNNVDGVDKAQKVTFTLEMGLTNAEALLIINGSPPADGTPNATDIGYGLSQLTVAANQRPCGIALVELATTGGSYTDTFTTIEGTSFTAKSISDTKDHRMRSTPIAVDVEVKALCQQSGTAEVGQALIINQRLNDLRITLKHINVATSAKHLVTLGANVGCRFDAINAEGNISKKATIPLTATGQMTLAAFTACWADDTIA